MPNSSVNCNDKRSTQLTYLFFSDRFNGWFFLFSAANFNDVPSQMNLTDPKMSGIKGWFKNERAFQFPCIWQVCKFLWSPFYLQTPWKCRDQEEGVVFFEKIGHLKVALFKSRGNTILLALLLPRKLSLLN